MVSQAQGAHSSDGARRLGQVVSGRYRIKELLGEGGMGSVYLAEHTHMRKRVALKLLHPEMVDNAEVLARFEREAMAAAHIEHPNVAAATDFGRTDDGGFFLVLEYVEGRSLRAALADGPMAPQRALHIARQIGLALERAHDSGVVHRDLKPENVMLVQRGDDPDFVKVLDFGIAKVSPETIAARGGDAAQQPLTRMGTVLGTPEYMAPEQALGEAVTPPSDLYAVGIMLYEMLTGKHPFDPPDRLAMLSFHIVAPVPAMRDRAPEVDVPPIVEALVRRLLEKDAKARYASGRALVEAIDSAAASSGMHLASTPPADVAAPPPSVQVLPPSGPETPGPAWSAGDAIAKTSLGLPAATAAETKPSLVDRLRALPRAAQIGIAAALPLALVFFVTLIVILARGPKATTGDGSTTTGDGKAEGVAAAARPATAPADRVAAAVALGPEALEALAKEFPDDLGIQQKLVVSYYAQGKSSDAVRTARALAAKDGGKGVDADVVSTVAAIASQGGKGAADDEAFGLLEAELGERGVDALIDLSGKPPAASRIRATKSLAKPEVRAHASKAAAVLLDFKAAKGCEARRDLLDRAKEDGDARTLALLKAMKSTRGCGFLGTRDCFPCLRKDGALDDAIEAIEARSRPK
jgi:serine/threonine-protein kinase